MKSKLGLLFTLIIMSISQVFAQGFASVSNPSVDVLIVVDNSGSMSVFQERFSGKLSKIFEKYRGGDFKVGIITTDQNDSPMFRGQNITGSFETVVSQLMREIKDVGVNGNPTERHLSQVIKSFSDPVGELFHTRNRLKQLDIYIITDEEDQSEEYTNGMAFLTDLSEFKDLQSVKINLYANYSGCQSSQDVIAGGTLDTLAQVTGGERVNLCAQ